MTYRLIVDPVARRDIQEFAEYLANYDETFASDQLIRLSFVFQNHLSETPLTWSYFVLTGAPYRAYLFRVGRRIQYWIVYTVDEKLRVVRILRFRNVSRDPDTLGLTGDR